MEPGNIPPVWKRRNIDPNHSRQMESYFTNLDFIWNKGSHFPFPFQKATKIGGPDRFGAGRPAVFWRPGRPANCRFQRLAFPEILEEVLAIMVPDTTLVFQMHCEQIFGPTNTSWQEHSCCCRFKSCCWKALWNLCRQCGGSYLPSWRIACVRPFMEKWSVDSLSTFARKIADPQVVHCNSSTTSSHEKCSSINSWITSIQHGAIPIVLLRATSSNQ